ncbi:SpoIIE family protein phosphatase [Planctomicrobium piriforme]|uniref:Serine phosphatase RsbU, regulator of sigma subunit n=1 Tax=Planctomicrobium piriforme TaxID=1576369 RepID=A0A1I3D398_9PLAN|nr:SpoIIE family protein phosphatase [Planctomicrobium piriforme]SFH81019.1 Serine phosphatase RsbU, regulator of sigma subunit [Planctomicrobium piriforme]
MAILQVISGAAEGTQFPLMADRTILGRHPNCQVVLQSGVVSRHHAQVLESHGTFYIEDLRSRNGTFVNDRKIEGRTELQDGDELRLCDILLQFVLYPSTSYPVAAAEEQRVNLEAETMESLKSGVLDQSQIFAVVGEDAPSFESSTSIRKLSGDSTQKSTIDPSVKLKAILEFTQALGRDLQIESVLPKMLGTLFNIFPQAEQGFVLLKDAETGKLKVKASRTRGGGEAETVAVSMTVVRHALQTLESILSRNISDDSRFKRSTALSRMRITSIMCVPMVNQDEEGIGVIQIVTRDDARAFSEEDLDLLASLATQATMAVENARLHEEHVLRRELERDLEFATQVQLGFLPKSRPNVPDYSFGDYYEAALSVGGDYFDYISLPDGRVAMAIGDVAGKGMPAALLMARLYSSTRYQLLTKKTVEEAVSGLNEEIGSSGLGHRFITFLLMLINPLENTLTIVNAGHPAPLLRKRDGQVAQLARETSSLPLGIMPELTYQSATVTIAPGDTIIAYTDGVTEAMSDERDIYGADRLTKLLSRTNGPIGELISRVVEDVEGFMGDATSRDDTCIIGVHRSES